MGVGGKVVQGQSLVAVVLEELGQTLGEEEEFKFIIYFLRNTNSGVWKAFPYQLEQPWGVVLGP